MFVSPSPSIAMALSISDSAHMPYLLAISPPSCMSTPPGTSISISTHPSSLQPLTLLALTAPYGLLSSYTTNTTSTRSRARAILASPSLPTAWKKTPLLPTPPPWHLTCMLASLSASCQASTLFLHVSSCLRPIASFGLLKLVHASSASLVTSPITLGSLLPWAVFVSLIIT